MPISNETLSWPDNDNTETDTDRHRQTQTDRETERQREGERESEVHFCGKADGVESGANRICRIKHATHGAAKLRTERTTAKRKRRRRKRERERDRERERETERTKGRPSM